MSDEYRQRDITRIQIEKVDGETPDAYQAFLKFASLQYGDRTRENVAAITGYSMVAINGWSTKFNWMERANVLDAEEEILLREDRLNLMKRDNVRYAERARKIKDKAFDVGEAMVDAAQDLLSNVKFIDKVIETDKVRTDDGREVALTTEIHFKAKVSDIPRLADVGMKITQLAAGLPTEIIEPTVIKTNDLKNLSREELIARLEQTDKNIADISGKKKLKLVSNNNK